MFFFFCATNKLHLFENEYNIVLYLHDFLGDIWGEGKLCRKPKNKSTIHVIHQYFQVANSSLSHTFTDMSLCHLPNNWDSGKTVFK